MGGRALTIRTDRPAEELRRLARRDAVARCNAEGLVGPHDRPRPGRPARLDGRQKAALRQVVLDGPEVEATGLSAWTLPELCREVEQRWGCRTTPRIWAS